ncbi:MAG: IMP cyclohydrolase [Clostridia bacterium]|nr:IMP cyclohydrolase [Clostridia bacterium]
MSYETRSMKEAIAGNPYVGRGIVIGKSEDGSKAVFAYFIMGRSENSRNRIFVEEGDALRTRPFDESKVQDPSLIIYYPVKVAGSTVIVTNGDQTDTIEEYLKKGKCFRHALSTREFEPDAPNFTPRISGVLNLGETFTYSMSILKSADEKGSACNRYTFDYAPLNGVGHFIHTYVTDGNPLPTFAGEPERVKIPNDVKAFAEEIWNNLDPDNKISLYCRSIDLKSGKKENVLINRYTKE